jgi:isocitrate dehydrogenase (NAD+)
MAHRVTLLPGDGIGPEVVEAARRALEATGVALEWDTHDLGVAAFERHGTPVPATVIDSIRASRVALKGPTATPAGSGFRSANLSLREELDLYVGIRPCRDYRAAPRPIDVVVVRMNHEDLYAGIEYAPDDPDARRLRAFVNETRGARLSDETGLSLKPLSPGAARRVARAAFAYAERNGRSRVTAGHKATVMRQTDGIFLAAARETAGDHPELEFDDRLIDTLCAQLVRSPEELDVLVLPVMYGDIVSDLAAALAGGIGMAPGANLGDEHAIFEAVHGTAPKYAGQDRANPMGLMLSGAMLLRHLGEGDAANRLESAIGEVVRDGSSVTFDMRPSRDDPAAARTSEVADAVIARLRAALARTADSGLG